MAETVTCSRRRRDARARSRCRRRSRGGSPRRPSSRRRRGSPSSRAYSSTACEPNWMKKSTPSFTRRPASSASRITCGVEVEVGLLAGGAGAAVGDVDAAPRRARRCSAPFVGSDGMPRVGIAGRRHHRPDRARGRSRGRRPRTRAPASGATTLRAQRVERRRPAGAPRSTSSVASSASHDARLGRALGGHVGERGALVGRERARPGPAELHHAVERVLRAARGGPGCGASRPSPCTPGAQPPDELEADRLGHLDEREARRATSAAYSVAPTP